MLAESLAGELRQVETHSLSLLSDFKSVLESRAQIKAQAEILRRAHSGSLFGDHALTYHRDFAPPRHGFDVEWGHLDGFGGKHNEDWIVYSLEELLSFVYGTASFDEVDLKTESWMSPPLS